MDGLYRSFAEYAWSKLEEETGWWDGGSYEEDCVPDDLKCNMAPAKGFPETNPHIVRMTNRAMRPNDKNKKESSHQPPLVRYARYALLETLPVDLQTNNTTNRNTSTTSGNKQGHAMDENNKINNSNMECFNISTVGIQVLNFVILPSNETNLPVLGIDLVSLPGNKHLLLIDAQPMVHSHHNPYEDHWDDWHAKYVTSHPNELPWGGDIPPPVAKYVSRNALWTRLVAPTHQENVHIIQSILWDAFQEHVNLYIQLLSNYNHTRNVMVNDQWNYTAYRRENDPAKPMLKSLYGPEWTERLLHQVLFP